VRARHRQLDLGLPVLFLGDAQLPVSLLQCRGHRVERPAEVLDLAAVAAEGRHARAKVTRREPVGSGDQHSDPSKDVFAP
jgi:hypothetical protein